MGTVVNRTIFGESLKITPSFPLSVKMIKPVTKTLI